MKLEFIALKGAFVVPLACISGLFVAFAVEERDLQKALVVREPDVARIGDSRGHIARCVAVVVDQHVGQQPALRILVPDADAHAVDAIEEEPVLKFEGLVHLANVVDRAEKLLLAYGTRSLMMKKLPMEISPTTTSSGLMILGSDIPADFIASNS